MFAYMQLHLHTLLVSVQRQLWSTANTLVLTSPSLIIYLLQLQLQGHCEIPQQGEK